MKKIDKGPPPKELTEYRSLPDAVYDGPLFTEVKNRIRAGLLEEQGYLCAYCMCRIDEGAMKIEHWRSRKRFPDSQLDYGNLLGVCFGNQGQPKNNATCDTQKGDRDLCFNPANKEHHARLEIYYTRDGKIHSSNEVFDDELDRILNLNWYRLRKNRKSVWDGITDALSRKDGPWNRQQLSKLIAKWARPNADGKRKEYCDVAVFYLEKKMKRASK